ncbi:MAG TPA: response regulator [Thermoanaerobaculia bacterium]|jgi:DNA-binding response OmpR family regulator|nr:response regulator [Thermoanaerobaculia bacterium]
MRRDERILVVEDNPVISRSIEERFNCDCATDGWDAIGKLETGDYAAIVIDADVPRHSGYGVLAYLREEVGEALQNVIFMTSSDREAVKRDFGARLTVVDKDQAMDEITRVLEG